MTQCTFEPQKLCKEEAVINFDYCISHLNTPRGLQHMVDRVRTGRVLVQSDIDRHVESKLAVPDKDVQTTALEKMLDALERVTAFERYTEKLVANLDSSDWRFLDRTGSEQLRSEVQLYERAMERTARVLKDTSKMAIQEKMVSLGRAQTELMVRVLMGVISDMGMSAKDLDRAKGILLQKLMAEGNLDSRTKDDTQKRLTAVDAEVVDSEAV